MATVDEIKIVVKAEVDAAIAKMKELEKVAKDNKSAWGQLKDSFALMRDAMQGPIAAAQQVYAVFQKVNQYTTMLEDSWSMAAEASAILTNTLRSTGAEAWTSKKRLDDMAASIQKMTKYEDDAVSAMQGILLGFRNITGKEFDSATMAVLDMATVMKMDLVSAAQAVGKALDNPAEGMDSLSRQGFKFTQQEKDMMKAMQEVGNIAGAQKIILDELGKTYGGASKAAGELAVNLRDKLKNAQGSVNEELGRAISEFLRPFREWQIKNAEATADAMKAQNDYKAALRGAKVDYDGVIEALQRTKDARIANTLMIDEETQALDDQIAKLNELRVLQEMTDSEQARRAGFYNAITFVAPKEQDIANEKAAAAYAKAQKALDSQIAKEKILAIASGKELDNMKLAAAYRDAVATAMMAAEGNISGKAGIARQWLNEADYLENQAAGVRTATGAKIALLNVVAKEESQLVSIIPNYALLYVTQEGVTTSTKELTEAQKGWANVLGVALVNSFSALGSVLLSNENGWEAWGKAGMNAIAGVLEQWATAQAVMGFEMLFGGPVSAAAGLGKLGGAAAAGTAAGFIRAEAAKPSSGASVTNNYVIQNVGGSVIAEKQLQMIAANGMAKAARGY